MRSKWAIVVVLGAGVCLGAAAKGLKFPWASKELNKTVEITVLEKTILEKGRFEAKEPITKTKGVGRYKAVVWAIDKMEPAVVKNGVQLRIDIRIKDDPRKDVKRSRVFRPMEAARKMWLSSTKLKVPIWVVAYMGGKKVGHFDDDMAFKTVYD